MRCSLEPGLTPKILAMQVLDRKGGLLFGGAQMYFEFWDERIVGIYLMHDSGGQPVNLTEYISSSIITTLVT